MIIVCGLPGSGKTTFAIALARAIGAVHLNTDRIRAAEGKQGQYTNTTKTGVYESLYARCREELLQGNVVVLDGTFSRDDYRAPFTLLADELSVPLIWIEIIAPENVIRERVSKTRAYTEADFSVYQKIKMEFEPLPPGHLVLDSVTKSTKEMLEQAEAYLDTQDGFG